MLNGENEVRSVAAYSGLCISGRAEEGHSYPSPKARLPHPSKVLKGRGSCRFAKLKGLIIVSEKAERPDGICSLRPRRMRTRSRGRGGAAALQ